MRLIKLTNKNTKQTMAMMATTSMVVVQSSARSAMIRRGLVAHSLNPPTKCFHPRALVRHFSAHTSSSGQELVSTSITTQSHSAPTSSVSLLHHHNYNRSLSSSTSNSSQTTLDQRRHSILTHALQRVHDEGWSDEAIASGTLDAGLPPSYIGQARSASSPFGSADLVAFFMNECNSSLKKQLMEENTAIENKSVEQNTISSRIHKALQMRLSMVIPFVASNRWHEGMAIGALPQNAYRTSQQLDEMANIVLEYAVVGTSNNNINPIQRSAVIAAYAAAELHLLSDGREGTVSGRSLSLSGEQYHATWAFLEARSAEVAKLIVDGVNMPIIGGVSLPNPTHIMAASAVASSLAGAALSLAAPSAAAVAGTILSRAMSAVLTPMQNIVGSQMNSNNQGMDGTKPSDYAGATDALPPFDTSEEIFPEQNGKATS